MQEKVDRALITEALRESNAIEDVWDEESLVCAALAWDYAFSRAMLTPDVVSATHGVLMKNQPLLPDERGAFRTCRIYIGGREGTRWHKIPSAIHAWCEASMRSDPDWKALHIAYEKIHPFVDGNGRTGRIFMNWIRVKRCGLPPLVIYEKKKWEYYEWFR